MPNKYDKYFKILELDIQASKEDVKKAFSELSHIWHPDNYMGKPSNIKDRATRKFKKISTAYQVLNEYLSEEDSDSDAEEKTKAEQERREREEKERKQREENERLKKEEEIRRKTEQERREREEKEHLNREELANKKNQEEKSKKKNTSWFREIFWSLIEVIKISFIVIFWISFSFFLIFLFAYVAISINDPGNATHQVPEKNDSEIKSWKRSFRGEIIGRQGLTLNLERNGDNFKGDYIDVHEMKKKILIGKFDNKFPRNLVLDEYIDEKKSGSFYGNFTTGKEIEGEYISQSEPNNKLKFKLKEIDAPRDESRKTTSSHFPEQGLKGYKNKDYKKALERLKPLAEQGNASAQTNLGWMYANGQGVPQDYKTAVKWYRLSAEQGHASAQTNLGSMYESGQGVPQDYKKAIRLYRLSAEQGNASAQSNLGVMYAKGQGVPQDYKTAVKLWRLSAEKGNALAQTNLGVMYTYGQGVPQDYKEAIKWYRLSAERGVALGQFKLGLMYASGRGVPKDMVLALMWLNLADSNGYEHAKEGRTIFEKSMTSQQIEKAQELARNWKPTKKDETNE